MGDFRVYSGNVIILFIKFCLVLDIQSDHLELSPKGKAK